MTKTIDSKSESMRKRLMAMRTPIVESCIGCNKIEQVDEKGPSAIDLCKAYISPEKAWRLGPCALASHVRVQIKDDPGKKRVGQQKQKRKK